MKISLLIITLVPLALANPTRLQKGLKSISKSILSFKDNHRNYNIGAGGKKQPIIIKNLRDERSSACSDAENIPGTAIRGEILEKTDIAAIFRDSIKILKPGFAKEQIDTDSHNLEMVKLLIAENSVDQNVWLYWALAYAISHDHYQVVNYLLESPDIKAENIGSIVMDIASEFGKLSLIEHLLNWKGPNGERIDPSPETLGKAVKHGHFEVTKRLLEDPRVIPTDSALWDACSQGHIGIVEIILKDSRIRPNGKALVLASSGGHVEVVSHLLGDPRIHPGQNENAALRYASFHGHLPVVELLIKNPQVDPRNHGTSMAIKWALIAGHHAIVSRLGQWRLDNEP